MIRITKTVQVIIKCDTGVFLSKQAVEAALLQLPVVNGCCVVAHGEEGDDKYLAAYIVPEGNKV